ncbi:MAG TPA: hypothetical protein VEX60_07910 [Pyrinomonadaceae bacterium]|nr:hypothetical protein [Pyrinomonadaceae bacterium]
MKRVLSALLAAIAFVSCSQPESEKAAPKYKTGDHVVIGGFEIPGQVLESDCAKSPCKYTVRYLPPSSSADRDFRKEVFDEVELKPYEKRTRVP